VAKRASVGRRERTKETAKRSATTRSKRTRSARGKASSKASSRRPAATSKGGVRKRTSTQSATARKKTAARATAARKIRTENVPEPSRLASAATVVGGAVAGAVAAVTKRLPWTKSDDDAIALLERDHRRFEDLLKQGEETTERAVKGRTELLKMLTTELNLHELVEEKILYPALKSHPEARDIVLEGYQEHHVADVLTGELHDLPPSDEQWGAKFKVLKESLEHHIKEEENDMFRRARGIFSRDDLRRLGAEIARMKAEST